MMNFVMLFIFYPMPSGLVIYWTVMNLLTALQQWLALRGDSGPVVVAGAPSKVERSRSRRFTSGMADGAGAEVVWMSRRTITTFRLHRRAGRPEPSAGRRANPPRRGVTSAAS